MKGCTIGIDAPGTEAIVRRLSRELGYSLTLQTGDVSVTYYARTIGDINAISVRIRDALDELRQDGQVDVPSVGP